MTNEQRKRVHDITYSTEDREELAERIVKLEDERDLYSGLVEVMDHPDTANQLRVENVKLRELAQAMAEVAYEGQMLCDKCRFFHGCYNGGKKEHEGRGCQWVLWARELGIEVEE